MSVAEVSVELGMSAGGAPPRHIDACTEQLDMLAREWLDWQKRRKAMAQRGLPEPFVQEALKLEARVSRLLTRTLRQHALWPWLSQFPGLGGAHVALTIGRIGDPRRFPGQHCSEGHYLPPLYKIGEKCPVVVAHRESDSPLGDGAEVAGAVEYSSESERRSGCPGTMLAPRTTTGVRSLWHWAALHADAEGRAPRMRKGVQATWEPRVRASVMQPGGIAEQIVRLNVPRYVEIYRSTKERMSLRVVELTVESEGRYGDAQKLGAAGNGTAIEVYGGRPLRPFEADRIARKVAAKAFLGDLLTEWKSLVA